jgi:hypothetical protein
LIQQVDYLVRFAAARGAARDAADRVDPALDLLHAGGHPRDSATQ